MSLSSMVEIAGLQSFFRSKPPNILKQLPNCRAPIRISDQRGSESFQPNPVSGEAPPKMKDDDEEEVDEDDDGIVPFVPSYRKEKPRPLPCWGRGVLRTPVSDLPDFTGVEAVDRQGELEAIRSMSLGRGRGRARNRGASSINSQSTTAPEVNMQGIQEECQKYLGSWRRKESIPRKPVRSPRSQSMLSNPANFLEHTTSSDMPGKENNSFNYNVIETPCPDRDNLDRGSATEELSQTNVIVEFPQTPSPASTSEINFSNDISLRSSLSDVSHHSPFLEGASSSSPKVTVLSSSSENSSPRKELPHRNDDDSRFSSSPNVTAEHIPSSDSTISIKSSLSTIRNEDPLKLESTPVKSSATTSESYYSSCDSMQSSRMSEKSVNSFQNSSSVLAVETNSTNNDDPVEQDSKLLNPCSYSESELVPLVNKKYQKWEESVESLSLKSSKKSSRKSKNNNFVVESKQPRSTFVPNIRNSSSSSVEENVTRKSPYPCSDTPQWDPAVDVRTGPSTWNLNQDFPQLSAQSKINSSIAPTDDWKMDNSKTTEFSTNKYTAGAPSESTNFFPPSIGLPDFLKVMSGATETVAPKEYRIKFDNIPLDISKREIEQVLKEHATVYRITLGHREQCQHAIVHCDSPDLADFFNGTAPFGSSVGDLRCKRL